jgi:hypothetical protein
MQGPSDPRSSGASYAKRGIEPAKSVGPKGPMARGASQGQHGTTKPSVGGLAAGPAKPSAKAK